ncbi:hypothetical protein BVRB_4g085630 [Beta vulgaris subsp. vulgaris]|nr:hypothetical protein BVRB_4g085630 [Beta vulgaris subsp. vulgaris]
MKAEGVAVILMIATICLIIGGDNNSKSLAVDIQEDYEHRNPQEETEKSPFYSSTDISSHHEIPLYKYIPPRNKK